MHQCKVVNVAIPHRRGLVPNEGALHFQSLYTSLECGSPHLNCIKARHSASQIRKKTNQVFQVPAPIVANALRNIARMEQQLSDGLSVSDLRFVEKRLNF